MGKTILLVEDFDDIRLAAATMLGLHGYDVIHATDGHEAVERARAHHPDLILMDLAMPGFDGFRAARQIRSFSHLASIPVVAITSHGQLYRQKALESGFDDVLDKGEFMLEIIASVEKYLSE